MLLSEKLNDLIKEAMLGKEKTALDLKVYKLVKAEFTKAITAEGRTAAEGKTLKETPLTEDEELTILRKMAKQRRDSIEEYNKVKRSDLAAVEFAELEVLSKFLPAEATPEEIRAYILELISGLDHKPEMKDMKYLMNKSKEKFPDIDGKALNKIVREYL